MTITERTKLEQRLTKLVLEYKRSGLSLPKHLLMLRLAQVIASSYRVSRQHVLDDYLKLTEGELESAYEGTTRALEILSSHNLTNA